MNTKHTDSAVTIGQVLPRRETSRGWLFVPAWIKLSGGAAWEGLDKGKAHELAQHWPKNRTRVSLGNPTMIGFKTQLGWS